MSIFFEITSKKTKQSDGKVIEIQYDLVPKELELKKSTVSEIIPCSKLFKPTEDVFVFVLSPNGETTTNVHLYCEGNLLETRTISLSKYGLGMITFSSLPVGSYYVCLDDRTTEAVFDVSEYVKSPLQAELLNRKVVGTVMEYDVSVKKLPGIPYTGGLTVNGVAVAVVDGMLSAQTEISKGSDISLELKDDEGNTATVIIPNSSTSSVEELELNNFGKVFRASLGDNKKKQFEAHGFSVFEHMDAKQALELKTPVVVGTKAILDVSRLKNQVQQIVIKTFNPYLDKTQLWEFENTGDEVEFEVSEPITHFIVGGRKDDKVIGEGYGTVFVSKEINVKVNVPKKTEPKETVNIEVESDIETDVLVLVKPKHTLVNYASDGLSASLKKSLQKNLTTFLGFTYTRGLNSLRGITRGGNNWDNITLDGGIDERLTYDTQPLMMDYSTISSTSNSIQASYSSASVNENKGVAINYSGNMKLSASPSPLKSIYRSSRMSKTSGTSLLKEQKTSGMSDLMSQKTFGSTAVAEDTLEIAENREESKSVVFAKYVSLEPNKKQIISTDKIEDIGEYEVVVFNLSGYTWKQTKETIMCDQDNRILVNFPDVISGESKGRVYVKCLEESTLIVDCFDVNDNPERIVNLKVKTGNIAEVVLKNPGEYVVMLRSKDGKILDLFVKTVNDLTKDTVRRSELTILKEGESIRKEDGKRMYIIPSLRQLTEKIVKSLDTPVYGCFEQTLSKLKTNAYLYLGLHSGSIKNIEINKTELENKIRGGVNVITKYYNEEFSGGLFGYYTKSHTSIPITVQCLRHMEPFLCKPLSDMFPIFEKIVRKSYKTLGVNNKVKDSSLMFIDDRFEEDEITSAKSASFCLMYSKSEEKKTKALEYLRSNIKTKDGKFYWSGDNCYMGGDLQSTCVVARATRKIDQDLFKKAFVFVTSQISGDKLFSTSDSVELVSLFNEMKTNADSVAEIDGKEVKMSDLKDQLECESIKCLNGEVIVRTDRKEILDYKTLESTVGFSTEGLKNVVKLGGGVSFSVKLDQLDYQDACVICKISTSGTLTSVNGGSYQSRIEKAFKGDKLTFNLQTVGKGEGKVFIVCYDMYNFSKIGVMELPLVKVT